MVEDALMPRETARTLSPRTVTLWRLSLLSWTLAIAGVIVLAGSLAHRAPTARPIALAVLTAGVVAAILWPAARYRRWSFSLGADDVVIRRGVLWRTTSIVPHARIQHVDTTHGPLERKLGLASVVIFTAGTAGAHITIPGLPAADADELRDRLGWLGRVGEAV
jgi:uncharacterized protein